MDGHASLMAGLVAVGGWSHDDERDLWLVTGPRAVRRALRDPALSSAAPAAVLGAGSDVRLETLRRRQMVLLDGPDHQALRRAFAPLLSRAAICERGLEIADAIERRIERLPGGEVDLVRELCRPVTLDVLGLLLDSPHVGGAEVRDAGLVLLAEDAGVPQGPDRLRTALDILDAWADADRIETGGAVPHDDLVANVLLLVGAGSDTTANLLSAALLRLLGGASLEDAVTRALAFDAPVQVVERVAAARVELSTRRAVSPGQRVLVHLGSGAWGADAEDVGARLAFGAGAHYCLGAQLARAVAGHVLAATASSLDSARVVRARWEHSAGYRGLAELFVDLGTACTPAAH